VTYRKTPILYGPLASEPHPESFPCKLESTLVFFARDRDVTVKI